MLHSRAASPKSINPSILQPSLTNNATNRSKSVTTLAKQFPISNFNTESHKKIIDTNQIKTLIRAVTAYKKKPVQSQVSQLPKVSSMKGKLYLGKITKPQILLKSQQRHNPWAGPNIIEQNLIGKKGLMNMVNMGIIPKNVDFTDLLNYKFQQKKQSINAQNDNQQEKETNNDFFATNPGLHQQMSKQLKQLQIQSLKQIQSQKIIPKESKQSEGEAKIRKKVKKSSSKKNKKDQQLFSLPPEIPILQLNNQQVVKNENYYQQLKKSKINSTQVIFKLYISCVQKFATKFNLKKFDFRLVLDETRKISDTLIKSSIINAKALGIHWTMKGNSQKRAQDAALVFALRYKYKRAKKDLLKIQNIKRYFRVKKFYQQMTKKRTDFLKYKLGSFAERQRRYIQQSKQQQTSQRFSIQIHIISISDKTHDDQQSYYKKQCRNNIQLTRLFITQPQYLIILSQQQQFNMNSWLGLVTKVKGYHPTIVPIFANFKNVKQGKNAKIKTYDSIYYGINADIMKNIKKISKKRQDICLYPTSFNISLVHICQIFNAKVYGGSFYKPYLNKLLEDQDEQNQEQKYYQLQFTNEIIKSKAIHPDSQYSSQYRSQNSSQPQSYNTNNSQPQTKRSTTVKFEQKQMIQIANTSRSQPFTKSQIKHFMQKKKALQLNTYQLISEHFSKKLVIKQFIDQNKFNTPQFIMFESNTQQKQLYQKFTQLLLQNRFINRWVFKIGSNGRFSRGLAFLQTDSLKILKEKKKKLSLSQSDFTQVINIMKVILLDKLQIPQNSLQDSTQYLQKFLKFGGYIQAVIEQTTTQCIFGQITQIGQYKILGSYSKLYTNQYINCAAMYPSININTQILQKCQELSDKLYNTQNIFGYITYQIIRNVQKNSYYFIDFVLNLQQYSSLYFMYTAMFKMQEQQHTVSVLRKYNQSKQKERNNNKNNMLAVPKKSKLHTIRRSSQASRQSNITDKLKVNQTGKLENNQQQIQYKYRQQLKMKRKIIYIPFIDNNGTIHQTFQQFQTAFANKGLKSLNFQVQQGIQFLYLNLIQQRPDVLSLLVFSKNQRQVLKYALEGLNFIVQNGENTHKFDKKAERRKYDCLYIHDIVWKFRQMKKAKDNQYNAQMSMANTQFQSNN